MPITAFSTGADISVYLINLQYKKVQGAKLGTCIRKLYVLIEEHSPYGYSALSLNSHKSSIIQLPLFEFLLNSYHIFTHGKFSTVRYTENMRVDIDCGSAKI